MKKYIVLGLFILSLSFMTSLDAQACNGDKADRDRDTTEDQVES